MHQNHFRNFSICVLSCMIFTACGTNQSKRTDSSKNELPTSAVSSESSDAPDYIEYPKVGNANEQLSEAFARLEGTWNSDHQTVQFYEADEYYQFRDNLSEDGSPILWMEILDDGTLKFAVSAGEMQTCLNGFIHAEDTVLIIDDVAYRRS